MNLVHASTSPRIAYFSMEVGLQALIPTYAGGLGILSGDILRSAADLGVDMIGVTLLYRNGYFEQDFDASGWQIEKPVRWDPEQHLVEQPERVSIEIGGKPMEVRAWRLELKGARGVTKVYFLDTDLPVNHPELRAITGALYGGDRRLRLMQEIVLGIGGVRMLRKLGYTQLHRFHMNEGHAALLGVELFQQLSSHGIRHEVSLDAVRRQGVFTTHTPIEAGHDRFESGLVGSLLEPALLRDLEYIDSLRPCFLNGSLNMTRLGFAVSHFVNGVSKRHAQVSARLFPGVDVRCVSNGVHLERWMHPVLGELLDCHIPDWRVDNFALRRAMEIPLQELGRAHQRAKDDLCRIVNERTGVALHRDALTIGLARRVTSYKRLELIFKNLTTLRGISQRSGPVQIVISGKAHPHDTTGKEILRSLIQLAAASTEPCKIVFIPGYDDRIAAALVQGVDLWLNTPQAPLEASGTSGMKAAANAVPSLSVLDGWWIDGCLEGVTGWAIGVDRFANGPIELDGAAAREAADLADSQALYEKLGRIAELYYKNRDEYLKVMRQTLAINGSYFHTQRVVQEYTSEAYL